VKQFDDVIMLHRALLSDFSSDVSLCTVFLDQLFLDLRSKEIERGANLFHSVHLLLVFVADPVDVAVGAFAQKRFVEPIVGALCVDVLEIVDGELSFGVERLVPVPLLIRLLVAAPVALSAAIVLVWLL
jgi:hypothetical protein